MHTHAHARQTDNGRPSGLATSLWFTLLVHLFNVVSAPDKSNSTPYLMKQQLRLTLDSQAAKIPGVRLILSLTHTLTQGIFPRVLNSRHTHIQRRLRAVRSITSPGHVLLVLFKLTQRFHTSHKVACWTSYRSRTHTRLKPHLSFSTNFFSSILSFFLSFSLSLSLSLSQPAGLARHTCLCLSLRPASERASSLGRLSGGHFILLVPSGAEVHFLPVCGRETEHQLALCSEEHLPS